MENVDKIVDKRLKNLEKRVPFTKENQPSPELKSKGWDERRAKQEIYDLIWESWGMSLDEVNRIKEDAKNNPKKYSVKQIAIIGYVTNPRMIQDILDRQGIKATQNIEIKSENYTTISFAQELQEILKLARHSKNKTGGDSQGDNGSVQV